MCFVETNRRGLDTLVVHESVSLEEVSRIYDQCPGRDGSETIEDALVACPAMNTVSNLVLKRTSAY